MGLKITDLVDQEEINKLQQLNTELQSVKESYVQAANKLVEGIKINIEIIGDIDKLGAILSAQYKKATEATEHFNTTIKERDDIIRKTTNTISRELSEIEKENAKKRESVKIDSDAIKVAQGIVGTREQNIVRLSKVTTELSKVSAAQKDLNKSEQAGIVSSQDAIKKRAELIARERELKIEKQDLTKTLSIEEKMANTALNSYENLSQQLELLKRAYRQLNEEEKKGDIGTMLGSNIQELDAHLKDLDAEMGQFQRNTGNYAIANDRANESMAKTIVSIEEITRVLNTEARTINEAEEQNKLLTKAIKQVDLSSDNAAEEIEKYNKKIEENNKKIKEVKSESEELVDVMADLTGVSNGLGSSIMSLSQHSSGNFIEGLTIKAKALSKTLLGLLSNPYVLAFLGIAGTVSAFKWWYDYNKGLMEATKLTNQLTGATGAQLKEFRSEVESIADIYDKDFREVLISTNALAKQFGIEFSEAIKLVRDGFIAGGDVTGEYLDNLKEYPAYFKEAGLSAEKFIAITVQANKSGIYSDKGIDVIKEGNLRIREMTTATADALEGIGISSKRVMEELQTGQKTTFDIMQEVSERLNELPDSSSAVGAALADIFGGPGEDAGLQYIRTLKDIKTNMSDVKAEAGQLGALQEDLLESQKELSTEIALLFDATGGSFESMVTKMKMAWNSFATDFISGIRTVFESVEERSAREKEDALSLGERAGIDASLKQYEKIDQLRRTYSENGLSDEEALKKAKDERLKILKMALNEEEKVLQDAVDLNEKYWEEWNNKNFFKQGLGLQRSNKEINDDIADSWKKRMESESYRQSLLTQIENVENYDPFAKVGESGKSKEQQDKELEELKAAAEKKKAILQALSQSEIDLMDEGYEKQIAIIKINYAKRISEIEGNSKEELELKKNLTEKMNKELEAYEKAYEEVRLKTDISNKLEIVEKGSIEEMDLRIKLLMTEKESELDIAETTGANKVIIEEKYQKLIDNLYEEYALKRVSSIQENYNAEALIRNELYVRKKTAIKKEYSEGLIDKEEYEKKLTSLDEKYAMESAKATIKMLEEQLNEEDISSEERKRLSDELFKAKANLADMEADAEIAAMERIVKADNEAHQKRMRNINEWLNTTSDIVGTIGELVSTVYDGKIEKIEEELDLNEEAYNQEIEKIEGLEERGAISTEEAEARKRAAKDKSAEKDAELEKEKAKLTYRQAIFDKGVQLAQTGIATARGIMEAMAMVPPNPVLAALIGVMGGIQAATIIATPIPAYAKGTDFHKGGPAIVGDGGKQEAVLFDGMAWITPDFPVIVNLPSGAEVIPDIDNFDFGGYNMPNVTVNNDYSKVESKINRTNDLLLRSMLLQKRLFNKQNYSVYKDRL